LRFSDLSAPLLEFHPTRQLFGAIKARGLYYQTLSDAPSWQKELSLRQYSGEATIEPPLMEHLSARLYSLAGSEQTAIPRAFSAGFWMLGGLFLYLLARNLSDSKLAAACALAFYLLLPYAVTASRAFQPDPLMVMFILAFWWSIENWGRNPTWKWALLSGLCGGLAVFIKFPSVFFILGGAFGAIFAHSSLLKAIKNPQSWVMALLGVLPAGAYLYYGLYMNGFLGQQFGSRFYPDMWISPYFYLRWFLKVNNVASVLWIMLAVFGWLFFASRPTKTFLTGLWTAYLLYGLTFAHHISSHDYYSLPLVAIIALGLAPLAAHFWPFFLEHVKKLSASSRLAPSVILILLLSSLSLASVDQYLTQRTNDQRKQAAFWAQVGNAIGHQPGVLALTSDYGYPLAYYGWQNSDPWPLAADIKNFDETFASLSANKTYFLVTDFDEYDRQPELEQRLTKNYPVLARGNGFIVFDLYHPLPVK
jgi:4-amino-4-deoxy-L-arabinose transferase-like glycosyltransferase